MAIYRFRVTFEEDSDIFRDIEIKSTQNFEDFHNAIINAYKFNNKYKASFYKSDDNWEMEDEIALCKKDKDQGLLLMKDCKLVRLITAPHQRFIYVHDPVEPNIFNIELLNIATEHNSKDYPFCSKSEGEAPIKDRIKLVLAEDEDEDFFDETEDEIDDGEAYEDAIDTDDLDDMAESSEAELEGGNNFSEEASKDYDEI
jgi:hypothetical protein